MRVWPERFLSTGENFVLLSASLEYLDVRGAERIERPLDSLSLEPNERFGARSPRGARTHRLTMVVEIGGMDSTLNVRVIAVE